VLGSIPFGYLLVKAFQKKDIREQGSGNIGATNVLRSGAKGLGVATLLLDMGKALAAVLIATHIIAPGNFDIGMAAAVAAVVGHVFPVWLGFRGGKGVASALGVLLALRWPVGVTVLLVFIVVVALSKYVSLASIAAAASAPFGAYYFVPEHTPVVVCGYFFLTALVIGKHHANIRRLMSGTENRFGRRAEAGKAGA
jgi:glycerol-3-phosphate acyltransferase PlsY